MIQGVSPHLESILAAGNHAHSNMNCQPWRFQVKGNHIEIFSDLGQDTSPLNSGGRLNYLTVGMIAESIAMAASELGYKSTINYFPIGEDGPVVSIDLEIDPSIEKDPLAPQILLRAANRNKFLPVQLSDAELKEMDLSIAKFPDITLHLNHSRNEVKRLAEILAFEDEITVNNREMHDFFFSHIVWPGEKDPGGMGLTAQDLDLSYMQLPIYYLLSNWELAETLSNLGVASFMAAQAAGIYGTAGAIGAISLVTDTPKDLVIAGQAFERFWLSVVKLGLNLQPFPCIPALSKALESGVWTSSSEEQRSRLQNYYSEIKKLLGIESRKPVLLFRIGGGASPKTHSRRRELSQVITVV